MFRNLTIAILILVTIILLIRCSKSEDNQLCNNLSTMSFDDNICLIIEHDSLTDEAINIIEAKISAGIASINNLMPIDNLSIRIVDNPQLVIPEIGIGGYNPNAQEVILAINANFNDLIEALEENLIALLAHEIHHAIRRRSVGYGNTLFKAAISEGLADHFSIEVTGIIPPPWAVALTDIELQNWIDIAENSWNESSYDHFAWFLGTDQNIPKWTGYSIGFELVKRYLIDNPNKRPSNLYDEPADSFLP